MKEKEREKEREREREREKEINRQSKRLRLREREREREREKIQIEKQTPHLKDNLVILTNPKRLLVCLNSIIQGLKRNRHTTVSQQDKKKEAIQL